jgi:hypothetical protein
MIFYSLARYYTDSSNHREEGLLQESLNDKNIFSQSLRFVDEKIAAKTPAPIASAPPTSAAPINPSSWTFESSSKGQILNITASQSERLSVLRFNC